MLTTFQIGDKTQGVYKVSFIRKIKRKGKIYLMEVENQRIDGKVRQKFIRYVGVDPDRNKSAFPQCTHELKLDSVKMYGTVIALDFLAKEIGLYALLGEHAQIILALVYCHCHDYRSLLEVNRWFQKTDLNIIFGIEKITEKQLDDAFSALEEMDHLALQKSIFEKLGTLCEEDTSSVLYDVTNTYVYGTCCNLAKKGKDKEGVRGRRVIQIGLGITKKWGLPIFHQVHPGNVNDSKIFNEAISLLKTFNIDHGTIVYDRGMSAKTSILQLSNAHWNVIGGMPLHQGVKSLISEMDLQQVESFRNRIEQGRSIFYVTSKPYTVGTVSGKLFIVINPLKKQDEKESRLTKIMQIQSEEISLEKSFEKFFSKTGGVNSHAIKRAELYDGMSTIFATGRHSREDVIRMYFEKDLIEKSFQSLKGVLALRPVRHWLDGRVKAHVLICFLAYTLLTTFRFKLKINGLYEEGISVVSALSELENVYRIYFHNHSVYQVNNPLFSKIISLTSLQEKILKAVSPSLLV